MSASSLALDKRRPAALARAADYLELTKPKIALLELVAVTCAALVAGVNLPVLLHALGGIALVAASASALNQWWERRADARMLRTADRPLPAGRIPAAEVFGLGVLLMATGVLWLALAVNPLTAGLALLSWVLYVLVYTPLKAVSPANTLVGAVAGALPVLMGFSAMGTALDVAALTLFVILFLWQFPHFMAIAWLYRDDYAAAGMKMLTVVEPTGLRAGLQAVLAALVLIPVSLLPAVTGHSALLSPAKTYAFVALAFLLGGGQLICAAKFLFLRDRTSARTLLRASLVYLPALLAGIVWLQSSNYYQP